MKRPMAVMWRKSWGKKRCKRRVKESMRYTGRRECPYTNADSFISSQTVVLLVSFPHPESPEKGKCFYVLLKMAVIM